MATVGCKRGQWNSPRLVRSGSRSLKYQLPRPRESDLISLACIDLTMAHCQLTIAIDARAHSRSSNGQIELLFVLLRRDRRLKADQILEVLISLSLYNRMLVDTVPVEVILRCYVGNVSGYYASDVITYERYALHVISNYSSEVKI